MNTTLFTPEYKVLNDLFGRDLSYIIPEYQRPYSWDCLGKTDKNNQVNLMWNDLFDYFNEKDKSGKPYFFGSMVMINKGDREFEVIDGQQRLTTLTLLFVATKCFLQNALSKLKTDDNKLNDFKETVDYAIQNIEELIFNRLSKGLKSEKKVKIERGSGYNYDDVLKDVMECNNFDQAKYDTVNSEQKSIIQKYYANKGFLLKEFEINFLDDNCFTEQNFNKLDEFVTFLKNRVVIIQVIATNFEVAYHVFEILNNRGLPLSSKDLLRNLIIKEFNQIGDSNANQKWVDLEENYELDNYFISRFVESAKARNAKSTAFNDLKDIYSQNYKDSAGKKKIESFYSDFKKDLIAYTRIVNNDFENKEFKNCINVLLNAGNTTYTHNFLLALFRNVEDKNTLLLFVKNYERYIIYFLLGSSKRFQQRPIYEAIKLLDAKEIDKAKKIFVLDVESKKMLFSILNNSQIFDNDLGKLLIAKYIWIKSLQNNDETVNVILNYEKSTLEHIIPQTISENTNWEKDFSKKFKIDNTYKLGNMTLLDIKMNSAARNYDFSRKKEVYKRTELALTNEMSTPEFVMNENYIRERHTRISDLLISSYDF